MYITKFIPRAVTKGPSQTQEEVLKSSLKMESYFITKDYLVYRGSTPTLLHHMIFCFSTCWLSNIYLGTSAAVMRTFTSCKPTSSAVCRNDTNGNAIMSYEEPL